MFDKKPKTGYKFENLGFRFNQVEIPKNWNVKTIEDCCNILDSKRIPLNHIERSKIPGKIPYCGANGIQDYIDKHLFDEDLILLAEDGGNFDEYDEKAIAYFVTGKSWVNNHAHVLTAKSGYDLKFIFYSLVHKNILPWINGTTRTKLTQIELKKISFPTPKLFEEQSRISSILQNIDSIVETRKKIISELEMIKTSSVLNLIQNGIPHKDSQEVLLGPRFPKFNIPKIWRLQPLDKIADVTDSRHYTPKYMDDGYPLLLPNNVKSKGLDFSNTKFTARDDYLHLIEGGRKPEIGDIVFSRNASLGESAPVESNIEFSLGQDLVLIKSKKINPKLLLLILNSDIISIQIERLHTGTTFSRIDLDHIRNFLIPFPNNPIEESKIAEIVTSIEKKITSKEQLNDEYVKLKLGLSDELLTGQIRVKQ